MHHRVALGFEFSADTLDAAGVLRVNLSVALRECIGLVDVPRFMRGEPTLDNDKAAEVAALARTLEEQMGWPVDIECAYHGETLYLLQCRPITSLD